MKHKNKKKKKQLKTSFVSLIVNRNKASATIKIIVLTLQWPRKNVGIQQHYGNVINL